MPKNKEKVLVALSGGVDSAVAAYILKKKGYDVSAGFMKNFSKPVNIKAECPWKEDRNEAYRVAAFLDIPIMTFDFEKEYEKTVVKYLFESYRSGKTPNPDILCNSEIKFKLFLNKALDLGFDKIATGHYVRLKKDKSGFHLLRGLDPDKDQSYFLAGLNQTQLSHSLFPLGSLKKTEVRKLATRVGLPNADRPDSQGICFVGKVKLKEFLQQKLKAQSGEIIDTKGNLLGKHDGVAFYTIGQRKGLDLAGGPWFVIDKDLQKNKLIVGNEKELTGSESKIKIGKINWLSNKLELPLRASVQIRYRQTPQVAKIEQKNDLAEVNTAKPQKGVASGQVLAIYKGPELVASAEIM